MKLGIFLTVWGSLVSLPFIIILAQEIPYTTVIWLLIGFLPLCYGIIKIRRKVAK